MHVPTFGVFSTRTARLVAFDLVRLRARLIRRRVLHPASDKLHLGAGYRRVPGWLNVDVYGSECDVDLACGRLPWPTGAFSAVVSQHVIEHLELESELLPLFSELRRVIGKGGELWLSCPDMEKACTGYLEDRASALSEDRRARMPQWALPTEIPSQHFVNWLFQQNGEHRNLFDLELLRWALLRSGFTACARSCEAKLLERFPEMPLRNDDVQSLYVIAS